MTMIHAPMARRLIDAANGQPLSLRDAVGHLGKIMAIRVPSPYSGDPDHVVSSPVSVAQVDEVIAPFTQWAHARFRAHSQREMHFEPGGDAGPGGWPPRPDPLQFDNADELGIWWSTPWFRPLPGHASGGQHRGHTTTGPFLDAPCVEAYLMEDAPFPPRGWRPAHRGITPTSRSCPCAPTPMSPTIQSSARSPNPRTGQNW